MFPTVLGLLVLNIYPTFRTIYQSFFKTGDFGKGNKFVGLGNYIKLFSGTEIWIPLLSPTIFFVTITRVIGGFMVFDLIYMVMDRDNPALPKTQSLVFLFYQYAFRDQNKGMGAAVVVVLLSIIIIITAIQMLAQKK